VAVGAGGCGRGRERWVDGWRPTAGGRGVVGGRGGGVLPKGKLRRARRVVVEAMDLHAEEQGVATEPRATPIRRRDTSEREVGRGCACGGGGRWEGGVAVGRERRKRCGDGGG